MISIFPLLQKELIEYASTKRIYLLRILYGICIYAVFLVSWSSYSNHNNVYQVLGSGHWLLENIFKVNIGAIFIILPMVSSYVITNEKEKRTLSLLLLTPLSPSLILFEKLLGLVLSMFGFLLMSFPIMYMTYLLGGVTNQKIFLALYIQFLATVQVATLALFFSCYCKRSITAIVATYIYGFILYAALPFYSLLSSISNYSITLFFPPGFYFYFDNFLVTNLNIFIYTLPIWITVLFAFIGARYFLIQQTQSNQESRTRKIYYKFLPKKNNKFHIRLPIVWRENLNNYGGLSIFVVMVIGTLIAIDLIISESFSILNILIISIYLLSVVLSILYITIKSATTFQREIKQETWEILLTTTISTRSIFFQKVLALTKFTTYSTILLVCTHLFQITTLGTYYYSILKTKWINGCIFTILIFFSLQWIMMWLGLVFKNNRKMIFIALAVLITWCALPMLVYAFSYELFGRNYPSLALLSPVSIFLCVINSHIPHPYFSSIEAEMMGEVLIYFIIIALLSFTALYLSSKKCIRICD
ncbi:ABC transporter permease subunit [Candidatus Uabimicrobium sp. HlEnr_7]|uniref:ABC transporter permease subunit n=1 Tax=Candidatus Uabimicrobium helgolandensis TaxID=3095367 RepID=UPI003558F82F